MQDWTWKDFARWLGVFVGTVLPVLLGVLLLVTFLRKNGLSASWEIWGQLGALGLLVVIALIAAAGVRFILHPLIRPGGSASAPTADPTDLARNRIAPFVLGIGGVAILLLTMAMVVSVAILAAKGNVGVGNPENSLTPLAEKVDTILMSIFGAVLPIVATWVGTVIAFYFASESYREAAKVAMEASGGLRATGPRVTSIMVPYAKIGGKIPVQSRAGAESIKVGAIREKFSDEVTRVMIFEEAAMNPVYIIRKKLLSDSFSDDTDVATYRASNAEHAAASKRYGFLADTATTDDARRTMEENKFEDIFVTRMGQPTEKVLGWISDDMLKGF